MEFKGSLVDLASMPPGAVVDTETAANALNRQAQMLRKWSSLETGPIRPVRIHGRLAWRVSDLLELIHGQRA